MGDAMTDEKTEQTPLERATAGMRYTLMEIPGGLYRVMRYGEPVEDPLPNSSELEFWFKIEELAEQNAKLTAACRTVLDRLYSVCLKGGDMQQFLDAGSMREIADVLSPVPEPEKGA